MLTIILKRSFSSKKNLLTSSAALGLELQRKLVFVTLFSFGFSPRHNRLVLEKLVATVNLCVATLAACALDIRYGHPVDALACQEIVDQLQTVGPHYTYNEFHTIPGPKPAEYCQAQRSL